MTEEDKKSNEDKLSANKPKKLVDTHGNIFYIESELSRGGQGVVYRTTDTDIAIKQPSNSNGESDIQEKFEEIRMLPLPEGIHVTLPISILQSEPGYVMRLLNGMKPLGDLSYKKKVAFELLKKDVPIWLQKTEDKYSLSQFIYYAVTGGAKKRYQALYKCAAILSELHNLGFVYGDISLNNVFIDNIQFVTKDANGGLSKIVPIDASIDSTVWLIDADNLRYERKNGGDTVYTERLGAPEIVQGRDVARPRTDCWAFGVMAFEMLSLQHPFIGKKVTGAESEDEDWANEDPNDTSFATAALDEQAYAGLLPYIYDENDDSNEALAVLPPGLVFTDNISRLFQETFGVGRTQPWRRPNMDFWAMEFAHAYDISLICPGCNMSYFYTMGQCPYCHCKAPDYVLCKSPRWTKVLQKNTERDIFVLPERMFSSFSVSKCDKKAFEAEVLWEKEKILPVRGTEEFPTELSTVFVREIKQ